MNTNVEYRKELQGRFINQQWHAGIIGSLKGTLIGIVSGVFLKYRYDHGLNTRFFRTPYKVMWIVGWNVVGIITQTNSAKAKFLREVAIEEDIRRNLYFQNELNGPGK